MPSMPRLIIFAVPALIILTACGIVETPGEPAPGAGVERQATAPAGTPSAAATPTAAPSPTLEPTPELDRTINFSTSGWETDFSIHNVPLSEISSGGPPRDGIPPIDEPKFVTAEEAAAWLGDREPVVALAVNGDARAYPLQIMIWHEIVNDEVGGVPVAVTFCPLCNTAITFDRRIDDQGPLRFGTTGNLRHSDLVMWDDRTESWWQQITGEAIVGELTGTTLEMLPSSIVSFAQFRETYPDGVILSRDTGYSRNYGANPYVGYDDIDQFPFLFRGPADDRLPPMMRVVTVSLHGEDAAYPFDRLAEHGVIEDEVGGQPIVVFWNTGVASALDGQRIAESRDVGATGVFSPLLDGEPLTFFFEDGVIRDEQTGSSWNVLGQATAGPLAGRQLDPILHGNHFWFAWAIFKPETRVWTSTG